MTCKLNRPALALAMMKKGILTQKELAEASHVSMNTISRGISGARTSANTVFRMANALGCDPESIAEWNSAGWRNITETEESK